MSTTRIGTVLAALAVAASATVAFAGTASAADDDAGINPGPPPTGGKTAIKVGLEADIPGFSSLNYGRNDDTGLQCPADAPWLMAGHLSPGRWVPQGVGVYEPGGIGVSADFYRRSPNDHTPGDKMSMFSATNYLPWTQHLRVVLYCTDDAARAAGTDAFGQVW
jgi:hypothetical protein